MAFNFDDMAETMTVHQIVESCVHNLFLIYDLDGELYGTTESMNNCRMAIAGALGITEEYAEDLAWEIINEL